MRRIAVLLAVLLLFTGCGAQNGSEMPETAASEASFGTEAPVSAAEEPAEAPAAEAETASSDEEAPASAEEPAEEAPEAASEPEAAGETAEPAGSPVLVVYFSRVGNTDFPADVDVVASASLVSDGAGYKGNAQLLAEWMADEAGCGTWEITTVDPYPADYDETTDVAKSEQNADARPALSAQLENLDAVETVYLVYPNWWGDLPMALYSFFDAYDFAGKTIYVSVTHGGSGFSGGVSTIESLEPEAQVVEGLSFRDSSVPDGEEEVRQWVRDTLG